VVLWVDLVLGLVRELFSLRPTGHAGWPLIIGAAAFSFALNVAVAAWFTRTSAIGAVWIWLVLAVVGVLSVLAALGRESTVGQVETVVVVIWQVVGIVAAVMLIRNRTFGRHEDVPASAPKSGVADNDAQT
jgi:hypothetical protein